ncbi:GNAT family N-acetyltransferase [Anaeromyxobacter sp. Fw109-5]|uniref:GNAT family N-acetyltransferase n=1 Tax=Anaeromyxobacter sp. (strain Fw109-5) TaxID=404589 RepID=UPI0002D992E0|nr:N-acetyltransferase [Anaeromyxobacter sp. Fw109-5]
MRVRPLTDVDLAGCLDLFEAVAREGRWLATEPPIDRREVSARWRALVETGEGTLLLAEEDDGTGPLGLAAMVGRSSPELGMLVAEGHRRRGVGDALLDACVAWARGIGAREVVLHVFPHNTGAVALYRKHGFEERGVLRRAYPRRSGERWDAIRMVKPLQPPLG